MRQSICRVLQRNLVASKSLQLRSRAVYTYIHCNVHTATFPCERLYEIEQNPNDFQLLERVPLTRSDCSFPFQLKPPIGDEKMMVVVDIETTGLDSKKDRIIELGAVTVQYSPSAACLTSVDSVTKGFEDPGIDISPLVSSITGITNDMVRGLSFDTEILPEWTGDPQQSPLILAHNARFDRAFIERRFPKSSLALQSTWVCSLNDINWYELNMSVPGRRLEHLLLSLGYFYEGHRATQDCLALIWLLHQIPIAFPQLLDASQKQSVIIRAIGAPFRVKDRLKERGYRWNPGNDGHPKHWWIEVEKDALEFEKNALDVLYNTGGSRAVVEFSEAQTRYKSN